MRLATYSTLAVRLANTYRQGRLDQDELTTVEQFDQLVLEQPIWRRQLVAADLVRLRELRREIRSVFADAAAGQHVSAVRRLNALLSSTDFRPQVTGHDGEPWHLHINEGAPTVVDGYAAAATVGLATYIVEHGIERLGLCQAPPCHNVFLDSSSNISRRYCSDRCATRANVAAYRARQRAGEHARSSRSE